MSPLGLLRFEWGFPSRRLRYETPRRFEFSIGGDF
jgi:outer membrane protein assembly factor BamA